MFYCKAQYNLLLTVKLTHNDKKLKFIFGATHSNIRQHVTKKNKTLRKANYRIPES